MSSSSTRLPRPEGPGSMRALLAVTVPTAVSVFPNEIFRAPRSWAEQAYPNLIYFNEVDAGNHFAAWQEPDIFTTEVRAGFRSLRQEGSTS